MSFSCQEEKLAARPLGLIPLSPGSSVSSVAAISSKSRIRWTTELHEKFVECVGTGQEPVMRRVLEDIGEWHGRAAEAVYKKRF